MNDSDDESDVENNGHLLHLIFRKKHGQQLGSIFADMVTRKQFILKNYLEFLKMFAQVFSRIRTQKRVYDRRKINS